MPQLLADTFPTWGTTTDEDAPCRVVTFVFTDIEDSTGHWRRTPDAMRCALRLHDRLLRDVFTAHKGHVFRTIGDAFCVAFDSMSYALRAALAAQAALAHAFTLPDAPLPLRVRIGIHTGEADTENGDYFGLALSRVARTLGLGMGGQVLLSSEAAALARACLPPGASVRDLGVFTLKGFDTPEGAWQLLHPDLPDDRPTPFHPAATKTQAAHNLPRSLTAFVGRERETAEVRRRVACEPLVTLTGAGGCGKTRLALEVARTLLSDFDGIWFVDLSTRTDAAQVALAVAQAVGLRLEPDTDAADQIGVYFSTRHDLVVLDNCEHLLDAAADLCAVLLEAAPHLRVLTTSREPLLLDGETVWPIPTLTVPALSRSLGPKRLLNYESVRLFVERATAIAPAFRLTVQNARSVAAICRRLDGIPLALLIAAAWANVLTPQQIEARLDDRMRLLQSESHRRAPSRQQTLRAAMEWSHALLLPGEREVLQRLSVFRGGWDLDAAEFVCGTNTSGDVSETLFSLVRKSLVLSEVAASDMGRTRYRFLEPVREWASELLAANDPAPFINRHGIYFEWFAQETAPRLLGEDARAGQSALERDHDNLRAALASAPPARVVSFVAALFWFWHRCGHGAEGLGWAQQVLGQANTNLLPADADLSHCAKALNGAGILSWQSGDLAGARLYFERSLVVHRTQNADEAAASCLSNLGSVASLLGDLDTADASFGESHALFLKSGNTARAASALANRGSNAISRGQLEIANAVLAEAQTLLRPLGSSLSLSAVLHNLADVARRTGDLTQAQTYLWESLVLRRDHNYLPGIADSFDEMALQAEGRHDFQRAIQLLGAASAIRVQCNTAPVSPERDALQTRLTNTLGAAEFSVQEEKGRLKNQDKEALWHWVMNEAAWKGAV